MIRIVIGSLILLGVFAGMFAAAASQLGWRVATAVWAASFALAALILLAIWLIGGAS